MILVIDNYDSFAYNLVQYLGELGQKPMAYRNDKTTIQHITHLNPTHIIISPGPGTPLSAGITNQVTRHFAGKIPILGVCLGHQCIGYTFGAKIVKSPKPAHGKSCLIYHDCKSVYSGLKSPFKAGRYHSLSVDSSSLPPELSVTAWSDCGLIMGLRHKKYVVEGVQFHPESVLTPDGHDIIRNFIQYSCAWWDQGAICV